MPDPPVAHGVPQRGGDVLLPDELGESLWAVLAVQRLVGHGATVASVNSRIRGWEHGEVHLALAVVLDQGKEIKGFAENIHVPGLAIAFGGDMFANPGSAGQARPSASSPP